MFWFHPLILRVSFLFALNIHLAQHPSRTPCHGVKIKQDIEQATELPVIEDRGEEDQKIRARNCEARNERIETGAPQRETC